MSNELSVVVWAKDGCSYCQEVKDYFQQKSIEYKIIDVTNHDEFRNILDIKYGIRYVPVVELGIDGNYRGVTELGIPHLEKVLDEVMTSL